MAPVAWLIGIPWAEARTAGSLLGTKIVLNEFLAFMDMAALPPGALSEHSRLILAYAMCSFANFGSLGILIAGLGTLCPDRRGEITALGMRSLAAGAMASLMTGSRGGRHLRPVAPLADKPTSRQANKEEPVATIEIDLSRCERDGLCISECPVFIFQRGPDKFPVVDQQAAERCIDCGHCMAVCPPGVISMNGRTAADMIPLDAGLAVDPTGAEQPMRARRSVRRFRRKPVDRDTIRRCIDVARYAPSGMNTQPCTGSWWRTRTSWCSWWT